MNPLPQTPWHWIFYQCGTCVALGIGVIAAASAKITGSPWAANLAIAAGLTLSSFVSSITAVKSSIAAGPSSWAQIDAAPPAAAALAAVILAIGVSTAEVALIYLCCGSGALLLVSTAIYYSIMFDSALNLSGASVTDASIATLMTIFVHVGLLEGVGLLTAAAIASAQLYRSRKERFVADQADRAARCAVLVLASVRDAENALPAVRNVLEEMRAELPAEPASHGVAAFARERAINDFLTASLDTILLQAGVLGPELHRKTQEWGLLCHGCLPVAATTGAALVTCDRIVVSKEPSLEARIVWPPIKPLRQALRELGLRAAASKCNGAARPDRLGCCSAALYFRDVGGLLALLEALRRDPEARVVALRDRLRAQHPNDHQWTFSSRGLPWCVAINFRINSDETRRLGLEAHVAELKLFLASGASGELAEVSNEIKIP